ncbi:DNA polymerase III PolC-type-like isoform X1 [Gymnodraco acuticeps]|uniref:exodeoxyribonuclease III n=1 Tax=Gymnodraco acuticeps TaxID=8218 RepID=A0A6P8VMY3_GYMAC|nr:DNA polymerase III PolC-type-like isoform X1 [Gymnodraco acuticeps]XP_034091969.1 DNA polymerase III PolC-type-like isoform X1 [Gymnodraco acuticeps]
MSGGKIIVFFDLEATGLDTDVCDIIQLGAICGRMDFNRYILPTRPLTESAKQVTGLTCRDGCLFLRRTQVETVPMEEALTSFLDYLRSFRKPVLLAAHSAMRFDAPVITRWLRKHSLHTEFKQVVSGFVDTFPLSKNLHRGLSSYSQVNMVRHFLGKTYSAHNGVEDASMLQELFNSWSPSQKSISRVTYST